ncbi:oxidoreductase [Halobacillus halophilus]|uniref:Alcohol dehydrogenase n=1 Tax=Halobacillus halophilus (strain ATCC 35676 / DSM 2266 / JCM 20832 / KCTC 3685 / LMG 17431 / NBRC 102448 / NCIMB 2269) TaxID=866895 RepID=I0JNL2_HALH3|nr:iron-containing alcohol dehydrogenase family protein [Halobacillus halophilus]ASF39789.1 oxidoreductase [Halobacillus halophilus]CCG45732.1 alcohol dehydrogenase [Halobacillus halophilus DSM 2266]
MESIHVQGAPTFYCCEPGVLGRLPKFIEEHTFEEGAVISGEQSWEAAEPFFPDLNVDLIYKKYRGECTHAEVDRLCKEISGSDVIFGVGGGKVLDLCKACGNELNLPVILIPTLASNCAGWTSLSVFYDEAGNFIEYTIFQKSTLMLIVDPALLVHSPVDFLRAGIGDTIAKWYEADVLTRNLPTKPIPLDIALHAAKLCRDVLIEDGNEALGYLRQTKTDPVLTRVVETIILSAGMVGGFGDRLGRIAGAHSIHNGLTKVNETHQYLHGDKVAYGILIQLLLEKRENEVQTLLSYYKEMNLPIHLSDLGVDVVSEEIVDTISSYSTAPNESIHLMGISDNNKVKRAIYRLEELGR